MEKDQSYRPRFHIEPPQGWLNDPNGSVWFRDRYHIFFQYSPDSPLGSGRKCWGHYTSPDLVHFTFEGISIYPDHPLDQNGVYSGTAWVTDEGLELYYTGNVKHPGNYDYINEGRGHNVLRVKTEDGYKLSDKEVLLENKDYPSDLSCHVRDPKIFEEDGWIHMLLGARSRDSHGGLLLMKSKDRDHWEIEREFFPDDFGFMLECPDYFTIDGQRVVAFCPQGVDTDEWHYQNIYNSGYLFLSQNISAASDETLRKEINTRNFREWDYGFDFYAPQTFETPDGRRILIGWAGVPDVPYGNGPSVEEGWQHTMTLLRELTLRNGRLYSLPVRELDQARGRKLSWDQEHKRLDSTCLDIVVSAGATAENGAPGVSESAGATESGAFKADGSAGASLHLQMNDDLTLTVDGESKMASLTFLNDSGAGRSSRKAKLEAADGFRNVRILIDRCMIEIFLNDGELAFTSRYYPADKTGLSLSIEEPCAVECYEVGDTITIS